ncbi:MAG: hypothetical protein JOY83_15130 [Alphaproteobacteria bacterium]|nr:hypothetical protein [Alphaproteobacteria bacterium]
MRAQSAALGMAAAAAVSSAAAALPCAPVLPSQTLGSEFGCAAAAGVESSPPREREGDGGAGAAQNDPQSDGQVPILADTAEASDANTFDGDGIKITNLQATMTSNRYVAGRLPLAPERAAAEELMMFSPDYLSIKILPRLPKRNPVGVGLITVPKPTVKDGEKATPAQGLPPARP